MDVSFLYIKWLNPNLWLCFLNLFFWILSVSCHNINVDAKWIKSVPIKTKSNPIFQSICNLVQQLPLIYLLLQFSSIVIILLMITLSFKQSCWMIVIRGCSLIELRNDLVLLKEKWNRLLYLYLVINRVLVVV